MHLLNLFIPQLLQLAAELVGVLIAVIMVVERPRLQALLVHTVGAAKAKQIESELAMAAHLGAAIGAQFVGQYGGQDQAAIEAALKEKIIAEAKARGVSLSGAVLDNAVQHGVSAFHAAQQQIKSS